MSLYLVTCHVLLDFVLGLPPSRRWLFRGMLIGWEFGSLSANPVSSSSSPSLQLELIMFLAATVNESKAASVESGVVTSRAVCHLAISCSRVGPGGRTDKAGCWMCGSLRLVSRENGKRLNWTLSDLA